MNGGTCIDRLDGFDCLCSAGYAGDMCNTGELTKYLCLSGSLLIVIVRNQ